MVQLRKLTTVKKLDWAIEPQNNKAHASLKPEAKYPIEQADESRIQQVCASIKAHTLAQIPVFTLNWLLLPNE